VVYSIFADMAFYASVIFMKLHKASIVLSQLVLYRGIFIFLASYAILKLKNYDIIVKDPDLSRQRILRNMLSVQHGFTMIMLINWIPITQLTVMDMTRSLVLPMIDHLINKTKFKSSEIVVVLASFCGVMMIVKPEIFILDDTIQDNVPHEYATGSFMVLLVIIWYISQVLWCMSVLLVKSLKSLKTLTVTFPAGLFLVAYSSLFQIFSETVSHPSVVEVLIVMTFMGCFGLLASNCFIRANQIGTSGKLGVYSNLSIVYAYLFEVLYLKEYPKVTSVMGSLLVISSTTFMALSQQ